MRDKTKEKEIDAKIGALLRSYRIARGVSIAELSRHLTISHQQCSKYEKGIDKVSIASLICILEFYKLNIITIFRDIKDDSPVYNRRSNRILHNFRKFNQLDNDYQETILSLIDLFYKKGKYDNE